MAYAKDDDNLIKEVLKALEG